MSLRIIKILLALMLAGLAIGASRGIVYLRHEYHTARTSLQAEIERARDIGWLGQDILGSGFDFDVEVFISPGGYILGEETALLEALEDSDDVQDVFANFDVSDEVMAQASS